MAIVSVCVYLPSRVFGLEQCLMPSKVVYKFDLYLREVFFCIDNHSYVTSPSHGFVKSTREMVVDRPESMSK